MSDLTYSSSLPPREPKDGDVSIDGRRELTYSTSAVVKPTRLEVKDNFYAKLNELYLTAQR